MQERAEVEAEAEMMQRRSRLELELEIAPPLERTAQAGQPPASRSQQPPAGDDAADRARRLMQDKMPCKYVHLYPPL